MKKPGNILIVDDNRGVLTAVQLLLKPHFEKIITLTSPVTLTSVLREETPSVVLLDMNFTSGINTGNEGLFWLQEIKRLRPSLPVVLSLLMEISILPCVALKKELRTLLSSHGIIKSWWKPY